MKSFLKHQTLPLTPDYCVEFGSTDRCPWEVHPLGHDGPYTGFCPFQKWVPGAEALNGSAVPASATPHVPHYSTASRSYLSSPRSGALAVAWGPCLAELCSSSFPLPVHSGYECYNRPEGPSFDGSEQPVKALPMDSQLLSDQSSTLGLCGNRVGTERLKEEREGSRRHLRRKQGPGLYPQPSLN